MIQVIVRGYTLRAKVVTALTSGAVGRQARFDFSPEWDDLQKIATFRAGNTSADAALLTDVCSVPLDVLVTPGVDLWIGVRGANQAGTTVIPTVWGNAGYIEDGATPSGVSPSDPEPDWTAQVQAAAASALEKATAVEEAAARGDFDGADGTDGEDGVSPAVSIGIISGGHSVTITDKDHPSGQSFNVMDGADGTDGVGVPSGGTTGQVLKKASGTDYDTEWADESGGGGSDSAYYAIYGENNGASIAAAVTAGKAVHCLYNGNTLPMTQKSTSSGVTDYYFEGAAENHTTSPARPFVYSAKASYNSTAGTTTWTYGGVVVQREITASGILKGNGTGGVTEAEAGTDYVAPSALNSYRTAAAQDTIDAGKLGTSGDGSNVTVAFTAASSRTAIATGEKLSVLFGKVLKWLSDLGTAAFRAATSSISSGSTDLIESGAVYTGLDGKQAKITASGILKGDGSGGVSAATAGTDYAGADVVLVTGSQPSSATNKLWINSNSGTPITLITDDDYNPESKTSAMTQAVGKDSSGKLWTVPGGGGSGITADIKAALLQLAQKVAYIDDGGQTYYTALYNALHGTVELVSISVTVNQGATIYEYDTLDDVEDALTVVAHYSDSSSTVVTGFTLSGTLAIGSNTLTVNYQGKTTTVSVTVLSALPSGYTRLTYVEADGQQYIDTGVKETEVGWADYEILVTQATSKGGHIFSHTNIFMPAPKGTSKNTLLGKNRGNETPSSGTTDFSWDTNRWYHFQAFLPDVKIDGVTQCTIPAGSNSNKQNSMHLFTYGGSPSSTQYRFYGKLKDGMRVYDTSNALSHYFITCKNGSDVVGIYDALTSTFMSSDSGTALIAGEVAV